MSDRWGILNQAADELSGGTLDEATAARLVAQVRRAHTRRTLARTVLGAAAAALVGVGAYAALAHGHPAHLPPAESPTATSPTAAPTPVLTEPPPTALPTVDVPLLGTLPQADEATLSATTPGWALIVWAPTTWEVQKADQRSILLASPDGRLFHLVDIDPKQSISLNNYPWLGGGTNSWQAGSRTAHVVVTSETKSTTATIDLLTGDISPGRTLTEAEGQLTYVVGWMGERALIIGNGIELADDHGVLESWDDSSSAAVNMTGQQAFLMGGQTWRLIDDSGNQTATGSIDTTDECSALNWVSEHEVLISCYVPAAEANNYEGKQGDYIIVNVESGQPRTALTDTEIWTNAAYSDGTDLVLYAGVADDGSPMCGSPMRWTGSAIEPIPSTKDSNFLFGIGGGVTWMGMMGCTEASATELNVWSPDGLTQVIPYAGDDWEMTVESVFVSTR